MGSLKRYIELSSGGGSVAQQFSNGGTMNGSLTVTGTISASQYLGIVTSTGNEVSIGGNSVGANMLIGTNDNFNLNLETAGTTKMTVTSAGNVGIGTTTPTGKLDVLLNPLTTYTTEKITFGPSITLGHYGSGYSGLWLGGLSGSTSAINPGPTNYTLLSDGSGLLINSPNNISLSTAGTPKVYVTYGGNVGIGTTAPSTKLEIVTTGANEDGLKLNRAANDRTAWLVDEGTGAGALYLFNGSNSNSVFITGNGNSYISGGGLGIGLNAAGAKLHVLGANYLTSIVDAPLYPALHLYSNGVSIGYIGSGNISGANAIDLGIQTPSGSKLFLAGGSTTPALTVNNGLVGIGTTNPSTKLHVYSSSVGVATFDGPTSPLAVFSISNSQFASFGSAGGALTGGTVTDFAFQTSNNLVFATGGTALANIRMFVASTGNVGIGNTNPGFKLDVNGSVRLGGFFIVDRSGGNNTAAIQFSARGATEGANFGNPIGNGSGEIIVSQLNGLIIGNQNATPLVFGTSNLERIRILANGNVGIATADPTYIFSVKPNSGQGGQIGFGTLPGFASPALYLEDYSRSTIFKLGQDNSGALKLLNNGNTVCFETTGLSTTITGNGTFVQAGNGAATIQGNYGKILLDAFTTNAIQFFAGSAMLERMRILGSNGNVGIGTTTPTEKLQVSGAIRVSGDFATWSTNTGALFYSGGKTGLLSSGPDTSTVGGFLLRCATSDGTGTAFNALTVEPTGCIGIGNVTPTNYTFSVNSTPFTGATGNWGRIGRIYMTGAGSGSYPDIGYNIRSVGGSYVFDVADSAAWITIDGNFRFKTGGSGAAGAAITGTERLTILASNGNVGIGATTPSTLLHIHKDQNTDTELRVQNSSDLSSATATINLVGSQGPTLVLQANSTTVAAPDATRALIKATTNVFGINLKAESTVGTLQFYTGGGAAANERLRITAAGNVGIGTSTPTTNFQVNQSTNGTGTISVAAADTTVTGSGTQFLNTFKVGDTITSAGQTLTISAISSNTLMTTSAAVAAITTQPYTLTGGTRLSVLGNGNILIPNTLELNTLAPTINGVKPALTLYRSGSGGDGVSILCKRENGLEIGDIRFIGGATVPSFAINLRHNNAAQSDIASFNLIAANKSSILFGSSNGVSSSTLSIFNTTGAVSNTGIILGNMSTAAGSNMDIQFHSYAGDPHATIRGIYNGGTKVGALSFLTANGSTPVEALRITQTGNVGVGTTTPASKVTVTGGDIELTDASAGVIFKTPDGTKRYRMTINNAGAPVFTHLP